MPSLARDSERHKVGGAVSRRHRAWNVNQSLRRLANGNGGDHPGCDRVDCKYSVAVLQADVNALVVAGTPDAMRQIARRNSCDEAWFCAASIDFDLVQAADGDVREFAVGVVYQSDVIGDRSGIDGRENTKRRFAAHHLHLTGVLEREPYFLAVFADGQVRRKRTKLRQARNDAIGRGIDHVKFRREARWHESVAAVGAK